MDLATNFLQSEWEFVTREITSSTQPITGSDVLKRELLFAAQLTLIAFSNNQKRKTKSLLKSIYNRTKAEYMGSQ